MNAGDFRKECNRLSEINIKRQGENNMLAASDLVKQYQLEATGNMDNILKIGEFVFSLLSLDFADAACSMVVKLVAGPLEKRIQIAKWDDQIEQCIRAADSTDLSQDTIKMLKSIVKNKLNGLCIDAQKLLRDQNYLNRLASDIVDFFEDPELERLTRAFEFLFQILSETLRKTPEFLAALQEVIIEHENILGKCEEDIQYLKVEVKELRTAHGSAEDLLKKLPALRATRGKPFAYNNNKLQEVYGRDSQLTRLSAFADDDRKFLFWVVSGPAGIGKSKLVFHFGRLYQKKGWIVRDLDRLSINELCNRNNWDITKDTILIIDYANEQERIGALLSKLCGLDYNGNHRKIRVVLIAREGTLQSIYDPQQMEYPQWYIDLIKETNEASNYIYTQDFLNLSGLSIEECNNLHKAYVENYLLRGVFEKDQKIVQELIESEVLDDEGFARPLYVLFVIDSYYNESKSRIWDLDSLQKQIYERDWNNWKKEISGKTFRREKVFISFTNVLVYTTIFGRWESGVILPAPLSEDCKSINDVALLYSTDYKSKCFKLLTGKNTVEHGIPVLERLTPDMVGEYYVLKRLSVFDDETLHNWASLMSVNLVDCKDFFLRAIQDFGNHSSFSFLFLKLLMLFTQMIADCCEETHKVFTAILETFFRKLNGSGNDQVLRELRGLIMEYVEKYKNDHVCAAEISLLLHENKPHTGTRTKISHYAEIEILYTRWPDSPMILSAYISFLGDIVASKIGAHAPGYSDVYIQKFLDLSVWTDSKDSEIQKAFIPVLLKIIERADDVYDWDRSSKFEGLFLKNVIEHCSDELMMDCIGKYDSIIIELAKEKRKIMDTNNAGLRSDNDEIIAQIDIRLNNAIKFFTHIIEYNTTPSASFIWTYVGKLAMITKNLFINQCTPHNEELFLYMKNTLQNIYDKYYFSANDSFLAWRVSRAIDAFCDSKSNDIPHYFKAQCVLQVPDSLR